MDFGTRNMGAAIDNGTRVATSDSEAINAFSRADSQRPPPPRIRPASSGSGLIDDL